MPALVQRRDQRVELLAAADLGVELVVVDDVVAVGAAGIGREDTARRRGG